jgi:hypothetical protein
MIGCLDHLVEAADVGMLETPENVHFRPHIIKMTRIIVPIIADELQTTQWFVR